MIGNKTITLIGQEYQKDLKVELREQGHYLTGQLERSMRQKQTTSGSSEVLEVEALDYIEDLVEGVPANHIDVNDQGYINGLAGYVTKRMGYVGKKALQVAYAIAKKHAREGMPTRSSFQYSSTGQRTFADSEAYNKHEGIYSEQFEDGVSNELDIYIDKTFDQTIF